MQGSALKGGKKTLTHIFVDMASGRRGQLITFASPPGHSHTHGDAAQVTRGFKRDWGCVRLNRKARERLESWEPTEISVAAGASSWTGAFGAAGTDGEVAFFGCLPFSGTLSGTFAGTFSGTFSGTALSACLATGCEALRLSASLWAAASSFSSCVILTNALSSVQSFQDF
jgi:hypothetical protein